MVTLPTVFPVTVTEHTSFMRLALEHDSAEKETDPEPDSEKVMVAAEPMHSPQPAIPLQLMEFPTAMLEPQFMVTAFGPPPPQLLMHGAGAMAPAGDTKTPTMVRRKATDSIRTSGLRNLWLLNNKKSRTWPP